MSLIVEILLGIASAIVFFLIFSRIKAWQRMHAFFKTKGDAARFMICFVMGLAMWILPLRLVGIVFENSANELLAPITERVFYALALAFSFGGYLIPKLKTED